MKFTFDVNPVIYSKADFIIFIVSSFQLLPFSPVMTLLSSPSSRSSSDTPSPLDLDADLTTRLQAASRQPPATNCAVLPNSEALGIGVPVHLPSLADEGLLSFTERASSEVVGGGHDTRQLSQQPGKSKNEYPIFPSVKGGRDPSFVSVAGLFDELVPSNDVPSAPLLPSVNLVPFSPSVFMIVDTRGGGATFGGVSTLGIGLPMTLRSRANRTLPKRYIHPVTPAQVKRGGRRSTDVLVRLFLSSSSASVDYCGGEVGRRPNVQACVATFASCLVSSHATKAETFEPGHLYIRISTKAGRLTVYLDPSVSVSVKSNASVGFLLSQEFSVQSWSSLLPRIASSQPRRD